MYVECVLRDAIISNPISERQAFCNLVNSLFINYTDDPEELHELSFQLLIRL